MPSSSNFSIANTFCRSVGSILDSTNALSLSLHSVNSVTAALSCASAPSTSFSCASVSTGSSSFKLGHFSCGKASSSFLYRLVWFWKISEFLIASSRAFCTAAELIGAVSFSFKWCTSSSTLRARLH